MKRLFPVLTVLLVPAAAFATYAIPTGEVAAQTFPLSMVGQLTFDLGTDPFIGSGTVVQPKGVLTAAHNLYNSETGWSTGVVYRRGHYNGSDLNVRSPAKLWVLAGYQASADAGRSTSSKGFARDTGGLTFAGKLAAGGYLGWSTDVTLLTGPGVKTAFGYGAREHDGEQLLTVQAATPFKAVFKAFYETKGTAIEPGMSGGPVICKLPNGSPVAAATVVSGAFEPVSGGVRIINAGVSKFILQYLATPKR